MKSVLTPFLLISVLGCVTPALADGQLIPSGPGLLYYHIGGGESQPVPLRNDTTTIPLTAQQDVGLNYNCGVFDPTLSISNSMNELSDSFMAMTDEVVQSATSAITELPLYVVAQADSNLYNLMNDGLVGADSDLQVSTKSCQVMEQNIQQGQNPYNDWLSVAMTSDWQKQMQQSESGDTNSRDINEVSDTVNQDNGKQGVPWVQGQTHEGTVYAGGDNEPAIQVVHDTVIAAYNVVLQNGRAYDDTSAPSSNGQSAHLVSVWANPVEAADWVTHVVGDVSVTTTQNGQKQSTPGLGLLPYTQQEAKEINDTLTQLVSGELPMTLANLQAVSPPGIGINKATIQRIQTLSPLAQETFIARLSQEAASKKIMQEALLARQLLSIGRQIPVVYNNKAAQRDLAAAQKKLTQAIKDFQFNNQISQQFVSSPVLQLLNSTQAQMNAHLTYQPSSKPQKLADGAVFPYSTEKSEGSN